MTTPNARPIRRKPSSAHGLGHRLTPTRPPTLQLLSSEIGPKPRSGVFGCVESIDATGIKGWLLDAGRLALPLSVKVVLDGVRIAESPAKLLRPDVSEVMDTHCHCGFYIKWYDLAPSGPLVQGAERKGNLTLEAPGGHLLPLACSFASEDVYSNIDFYLHRMSLVMGLSEVSDPNQLGDRELIASGFDEAFYLAMYPEARGHDGGALDHFLQEGWRAGLDPNPDFQIAFYAESNKDVARAEINPFLHYLRAGQFEGRNGSQPGGFRLETLRDLKSTEQVVTLWRRKDTLRCVNQRKLQAEFDAQFEASKPNQWAISVSHDDYTRHVGGIQLCIAKEQSAFNAQGCLYIHLSPWQALPALAPLQGSDRLALRVICNGEELGYALSTDLLGVLNRLAERWGLPAPSLTIHALHGHSPEFLALLHRTLTVQQSHFWIHDYFSVCNGYNLLRNNIQYCDAPHVSSGACGICVHGEHRDAHSSRIRALFEAVPFVAVAPSSHAAATWSRLAALPHHSMRTLEHCEVVEDGLRFGADLPTDRTGTDDALAPLAAPVRVAFLGHPSVHKGWPVFLHLARQLCGDGRFEFLHLGTSLGERAPIRFREVKVSPGQAQAMVDALADEAIDVVVQWSIWPETFGITARECSASGVAMVVADSSGAVADHVRARGGWVLANEGELLSLFEGDDLFTQISKRRHNGVPVGTLKWSGLTSELVPSSAKKAKV